MDIETFEQTRFNTARLRLEPIAPEHAQLLFDGLSHPEIYRYIDDKPPESVEALAARYAFLAVRRAPDGSEAWLNWILMDFTGKAVGYIQATVKLATCEADIAYVIFPEYQRQGFAAEAWRALLPELAQAYSLKRVEACIDTRNTASIHFIESLGFKRTEWVQNAGEIRGTPSDEYRYALPANL